MSTNEIRELAVRTAEATLKAYLMRPDKKGNEGRDFHRGFGKTKLQQMTVEAVVRVLSEAIPGKLDTLEGWLQRVPHTPVQPTQESASQPQ